LGGKTVYIQSAWRIEEAAKRDQEIRALVRIPDSFKKIIVVRDHIVGRYDDNGILYIGIRDVLLAVASLDG